MVIHTIVSYNDVFKQEKRINADKSVKSKLETDLKSYINKKSRVNSSMPLPGFSPLVQKGYGINNARPYTNSR